MPSIVCGDPTAPHSIYCPRHRLFGRLAADDQLLVEIRKAMIAAWSPADRCFLCFYSGVRLDESNPHGPFYPSFDHIVPGEKRLAVCGRMFNFMKNAMSGDEFRTVVPALSDHFETGRPFDRDTVPFAFWERKAALQAPRPRRVARWEFAPRGLTGCVVCNGPLFPRSMYCARCRRFITTERDNADRRVAMIDSWDHEANGFLCHYTHVKLEELDFSGPWYINFDHRTPGVKGNLAVAGAWVNRMKTFLSEPQFRLVVKSLANHFRTGAPFDTGTVDAGRYILTVRRLGRGMRTI